MELTFNLQILISCFLGYFIGSIPFGLIITKIILSKDLRNFGSGNIGATNVLRTGNKFAAFLTLLFDILKGIVPIIFLNQFISENISVLSGLFAILGHCFPVWLKFRGGKGVAASFGTILGIDFMMGISAVIVWLTVFIISRVSGLSAIVSFLLLPFIVYIMKLDDFILIFSFVNTLIILYSHKKNIIDFMLKKI